MRHQLSSEVHAGRVSAQTLAGALVECETWIPPLTPQGQQLFLSLERALRRGDEDVLLRARRSPMAVATLFALLPAPEMLRLFGPIEAHDERLLTDSVSAFPSTSRIGVMCQARMGYMAAVAAMARVVRRIRTPFDGVESPSLQA